MTNRGQRDYSKPLGWVIGLSVVAVLIWMLYDTRELTDALLERGVITLGRVTMFSEGGANTDTYVTFAYYYRGKLYKRKSLANKYYKVGDYVYMMFLPEKPQEAFDVFHRKVDEADTVLNLLIDDVKLSELEIRDMIKGKRRNYDNIKH